MDTIFAVVLLRYGKFERVYYYYYYKYMKGGNPKGRIWDDVVTYWNFDEYIEIYINITISLSTY